MKTIYSIFIFCCLVICGCCKVPADNSKAPKPLWVVKVSDIYIHGGGLRTLNMYNNSIITNYSLIRGDGIDNNRLCAVDINTREIKWSFPENSSTIYHFDGKGYIYGNKLVCKSSAAVNPNANEEVFIVNLDNHKVINSYLFPKERWTNSRGVSGFENKAYFHERGFINGERKGYDLYELNIDTGDTTILIHSGSQFSNLVFDSQKNTMLYTTVEYTEENNNPKHYLNIYDLSSKQLIQTTQLPKSNQNEYGANLIPIVVDKLYYGTMRETFCLEYPNLNLAWRSYNVQSNGGLIYSNGIIFKSSTSIYTGFDATTGKELYFHQLGSDWAIADGDYVYIKRTDINGINVIDIYTGEILSTIVCPDDDRFSILTDASIHDGKLYVMSHTSLYCYPTYPWN